MIQRCGCLDQSLPDEPLFFINNRTPNGFEGFVSLPIGTGVEEVAGAGESGWTVEDGQGRSRTVTDGPIASRFIAP